MDLLAVDDIGDPICIAYIDPDGEVETYDYADVERDAKIQEYATAHTWPGKKQHMMAAHEVGVWEQNNGVPNEKRLTSWHPEIEAHAPKEYVSQSTIAEKFNEIMGRQMQAEADPLVEIRSSVHSNYAGMVAMLGADNRIYLGKAGNLIDNFGEKPSFYNNRDGSLCYVSDRPDMYYFLYGEGWHRSQDAILENGLSAEQYAEFAALRDGVLRQFEQTREILFAGQPFQPPANYLRNAELMMESAKGNYNMSDDGLINNEPPVRADLTDGQTHDEIAELAPETLPDAKPSIMEQLKAERPEHRVRQVTPPELERGM